MGSSGGSESALAWRHLRHRGATRGVTMIYLEDFAPGQKFVSTALRVDSAAIKAFAAQFDPQPFHLDDQAARGSFFGGLAASGWHTAALTSRLLRRDPRGRRGAPRRTSRGDASASSRDGRPGRAVPPRPRPALLWPARGGRRDCPERD